MMKVFRTQSLGTIRLFVLTVAPIALATTLSGCGGAAQNEPVRSIGIHNPTPDNFNKDVTPENETNRMKALREKKGRKRPMSS